MPMSSVLRLGAAAAPARASCGRTQDGVPPARGRLRRRLLTCEFHDDDQLNALEALMVQLGAREVALLKVGGGVLRLRDVSVLDGPAGSGATASCVCGQAGVGQSCVSKWRRGLGAH